jgi:hypothetical protein
VKSGDRANHNNNLAETFANMRRAGLKLNPEKCVFGVRKGKILGCLISAKRIDANPDKIKAIMEMEEPKTKDIQKLNGRVAALNRFISRSAERSLPFFKALKGKGKIEWGPEQSKALAELKAYIEETAILSPPLPLSHFSICSRFQGRGQCYTWEMLEPYLFCLRNFCRMDLPGPTTSVGTRTEYSVDP